MDRSGAELSVSVLQLGGKEMQYIEMVDVKKASACMAEAVNASLRGIKGLGFLSEFHTAEENPDSMNPLHWVLTGRTSRNHHVLAQMSLSWEGDKGFDFNGAHILLLWCGTPGEKHCAMQMDFVCIYDPTTGFIAVKECEERLYFEGWRTTRCHLPITN